MRVTFNVAALVCAAAGVVGVTLLVIAWFGTGALHPSTGLAAMILSAVAFVDWRQDARFQRFADGVVVEQATRELASYEAGRLRGL